jgi:2-phosphoglycerate kinase
MPGPHEKPPWTVALVCGASGVGKTTVAVDLAARYGVPLTEADDLVTAIMALTTPQQEPILHYWDTHPDARLWPEDKIADLHLRVADVMGPAFRAVIADHVASQAPVIIEGDYLVPELAMGFGDSVRAVVLDEPDEDQIVAAYLDREPEAGPQRVRAEVSVRLGQRLVARARRVSVPVARSRPWADGLDRVDAALRSDPGRFGQDLP